MNEKSVVDEGPPPTLDSSKSQLILLFELADELKVMYGPEAVSQALSPYSSGFTGPSRLLLPSKEIVSQAEESPESEGTMRIAVVLAAVVALVILGWGSGKLLFGNGSAKAAYRPATLEEAHRFLEKHGVGASPSPGTGAKKATSALAAMHKVSKQMPKVRAPRPTGPGDQALASPPPLLGHIGPALPDAVNMDVARQGGEAVDLHGLEAKVRTAVVDAGGRVLQVRDSEADQGSTAKTLTISTAPGMARALIARIRNVAAAHAMISEPEPEESAPQGDEDPVKSSEVKAAEENLAAIKTQLVHDEVSFLPEAPALRSVRAEYAEALKTLADLRKPAHLALRFSVVLTSN